MKTVYCAVRIGSLSHTGTVSSLKGQFESWKLGFGTHFESAPSKVIKFDFYVRK